MREGAMGGWYGGWSLEAEGGMERWRGWSFVVEGVAFEGIYIIYRHINGGGKKR